MNRYLLIIFLVVFFVSCEQAPTTSADKSIRVETEGIYTPISFSINGKSVGSSFDLGEYVTASDKIKIEISVKNNTKFPMTDMGIEFPGQVSKVFGFYTESGGEGEYPGEDGTCSTILAPGSNCLVNLSFYVTKSGLYSQNVIFKYKNLVEGDNRATQFSILAGQPASLIYDDGLTNNFIFGDKVGIAQKPVLERADIITYEKDLVLINQGELTARNIDLSLPFACSSQLEGFAGDLNNYSQIGYDSINFCNAWVITHNCPVNIRPQESCNINIKFTPKNQDQAWGFDEAIEEVFYAADLTAKYKSTPNGDSATLKGSFKTYSTTIRAKFKTAKVKMEFTDEIIVGNYTQDLFKLINNGYREGEIKGLVFTKNTDGSFDGVDSTICKKINTTDTILTCFDIAEENILSLSDFPFVITERDSCLASSSDQAIYVPIDSGCVFDIRFQPSLEYISKKSFDYNISVKYDARWKGLEMIRIDSLFSILSTSLHAAKLKISKIEFDGREQVFLGANASNGVADYVDLGRLALLSQGYEEWRQLKITVENIGGAGINTYKFFSGLTGGNMGKTEITTSNTTVGPHAIKFFKDIKIDIENCGDGGVILGSDEGGARSKCTISMLFAPISLSTNIMQNQSMFDKEDGDFPAKVFSFSYHDASNFSDTNILTEIPDINSSNSQSWKDISTGITAALIEKGYLRDYSNQSFGFGQFSRGNEKYYNIFLKNIGTGPIAWIPYYGSLIDLEGFPYSGREVKRVTVANPAIYGANYDCNDVVDFDYVFQQDDADQDGNPFSLDDLNLIQSRIASKIKLNKLESCVLRLKASDSDNRLGIEANQYLENYGLGRYVNESSYDGDKASRFYASAGGLGSNLNFDFYDGDSVGQVSLGVTNEFNKAFGEFFKVGESHLKSALGINGLIFPEARLFIANPYPYMSGVIFVPGFTIPSLDKILDGTIYTNAGVTISNAFYAATNLDYNDENCIYFKSCIAPNYVQTSFANSNFNLSDSGENVDYVYHAGTFPLNKQFEIEFSVANGGLATAKILSESFSGASEISSAASFVTLNGKNIQAAQFSSTAVSGSLPVKLLFQANSAGTYTKDYKVTYETGRSDINQIVEFTVRIVVEAIANTPMAEIEYADYDPDGNLSATRSPASTGYNHKVLGSGIEFEAVQVDERSDTAPFLQKRIYIKNTSSVDMNNLSIKFKQSVINKDSSSDIGANAASSKAIKVINTDCNLNAESTLIPNDTCFIDLWYQPDENDSAKAIYAIILYDTALSRNQYIQQNLRLDFYPQPPSVVKLIGSSLQNIKYRDRENGDMLMSGQKAYVFAIGDVVYDSVDKEFSFVKELANDNIDTRASFLRQYEKHNSLGASGYDVSDIVFDIDGYVEILNQGSVRVMANSICLFGGAIESGMATEQKGFNNNTTETCNIKVYYKPGFNIIGRQLSFISVDDVSEFYFYLEYYNNKRSSTDKIYMTFTGKVRPPASTVTGGFQYKDVFAYAGSEIRLTWAEMSANVADLGNIVGYRVFYSKYPGDLGDVMQMMTTSAQYADIMSGESAILNTSYINDLTTYYIKAVAIRQNGDYTAGKFPNLSNGYYLSFSNLPVLKVTVPSNDYFYDHTNRALITYDKNSGIYDYYSAIDSCQDLSPVYILDNGLNYDKYFDLITQNIWDIIETDFATTTSYNNVRQIPHWIKSGLIYDIDAVFASVPGYDMNSSYQRFENEGLAYFRSSNDAAATYGTNKVAKTEGGIFNYLDYEGYMGPAVREGFARCYVPLDN